jgi:ATPase subunit of ABC transporter with duplicated ATPase domains
VYGPKILLHKTKICLIRGEKYGLTSRNNSGKTTHMRAIANKLRRGLLDSNNVLTVFVSAVAVQ